MQLIRFPGRIQLLCSGSNFPRTKQIIDFCTVLGKSDTPQELDPPKISDQLRIGSANNWILGPSKKMDPKLENWIQNWIQDWIQDWIRNRVKLDPPIGIQFPGAASPAGRPGWAPLAWLAGLPWRARPAALAVCPCWLTWPPGPVTWLVSFTRPATTPGLTSRGLTRRRTNEKP